MTLPYSCRTALLNSRRQRIVAAKGSSHASGIFRKHRLCPKQNSVLKFQDRNLTFVFFCNAFNPQLTRSRSPIISILQSCQSAFRKIVFILFCLKTPWKAITPKLYKLRVCCLFLLIRIPWLQAYSLAI